MKNNIQDNEKEYAEFGTLKAIFSNSTIYVWTVLTIVIGYFVVRLIMANIVAIMATILFGGVIVIVGYLMYTFMGIFIG